MPLNVGMQQTVGSVETSGTIELAEMTTMNAMETNRPCTRRSALKFLGVGGLGALLGGIGLGEAEAKKGKKGKKSKKGGKGNRGPNNPGASGGAASGKGTPTEPTTQVPPALLEGDPTLAKLLHYQHGLDLPVGDIPRVPAPRYMAMVESAGDQVEAAAVGQWTAYDWNIGDYKLVYDEPRYYWGNYYESGRYIGEVYTGWLGSMGEFHGDLFYWMDYLIYPNFNIWSATVRGIWYRGTYYPLS